MEQSLVILKPDTSERHLIGNVISRFEAAGLKIIAANIRSADDDILNRHYQIDNIDYCVSIGCKSSGIPVVSYEEAANLYSAEKAEELKNQGQTVLGWNRGYMKRSPLVIMIVEGNRAISRIRGIVGSTNPVNASPGTIRFDFGVDSIEQANAEQRGCENLVHASGNHEEAQVEISLWFPEKV